MQAQQSQALQHKCSCPRGHHHPRPGVCATRGAYRSVVSLGGLHELLRHGSQHACALAHIRHILPEVEGHAVHHHQLDLLCSRRC